ncbi:hypothetical protein Tdes44962_MAKER01475, partial [Teratosphaeria destructans]
IHEQIITKHRRALVFVGSDGAESSILVSRNTDYMPIKNVFSRRRSSGNALDIKPEGASEGTSSFRVIDRNEKTAQQLTSQARKPQPRPFNSPLEQLRGRSVEDLGLSSRSAKKSSLVPDWALKRDRGSAGTTNSGSSGFYESSNASARYSSTSTLPSSVDQECEHEDEELFPRKTTRPMLRSYNEADLDEPLRPPTSFSSRAARALSFGNKSNRPDPSPKGLPAVLQGHVDPVPPPPRHNPPLSPHRDRSTTISSYASTAVPTKSTRIDSADLSLGGSSFGDDFGSMFDSIGQSKSREDLAQQPQPPPLVRGFHRTESEPIFPPKTLSRQQLTPSPGLRILRDDAGSPYSLDGHHSPDALMSGSARSSPKLDDGPILSPPNAGLLGWSRAGYSLVPGRGSSPGLERNSRDETNEVGNAQSFGSQHRQYSPPEEDTKRVELYDGPTLSHMISSQSIQAPKRPMGRESQATLGALRPGAHSPTSEGGSFPSEGSRNTTPRATKQAPLVVNGFNDMLYDTSPVCPPSRAIRPAQHERTESGAPKKMTKAQFDVLQRRNDGVASPVHDTIDDEDDEYADEEDLEHAKKAAHQRQKNEANLAVYRQQMKKVTGGGPADLPSGAASTRPSMDHSHSAPAGSVLHFGGISGTPPTDAVRGKQMEDDDDDVPLGVLQAHGFPSAARPPTAADEEQPRRSSVAGSIAGGGAGQGNLPPFARRLPADPYFGASLVNPATRESLAFSSAGSAHGAISPILPQPQMGHPGGLVGIIAGEERAKAARRGSPNPMTGAYSPLPSNMPQPMPEMPMTMSMSSMTAPQIYTPSACMPGTPQMPQYPTISQDPSQAMTQQFMQMQMQLMQNMLQMQQQMVGQITPQAQQQPAQDYLSVQNGINRPMSMGGGVPATQQQVPVQDRAMTMMNPPSGWGPGHSRPGSSIGGLNVPINGLAHGRPASIAPSERSNVGQPSRYRPISEVPQVNGRSQSMTSSFTLNALATQQRPESRQGQFKSTIRVIDKPKGTTKASAKQAEQDDDEEGWAELAEKRKKFGWRKKDKEVKKSNDETLDYLSQHVDQ